MRARIRFPARRYITVANYVRDGVSSTQRLRELREHFILTMLEEHFIAALELDTNGKVVAT